MKPNALPASSGIVRLLAKRAHQSLSHHGYHIAVTNLDKQGIYIILGKQSLKS